MPSPIFFAVPSGRQLKPSRSERFLFTASEITYREFKADLIPDLDYRRGTKFPVGWDGVSFKASFEIGGNDTRGLGTAYSVLKRGNGICVIPVFDDDEQSDFDTVKGSIENDIFARHSTGTVVGSSYPEHVDGSSQVPPYVQIEPTYSDDGIEKKMAVTVDLYDGGTVSLCRSLPSSSIEFGVVVGDSGSARWFYDVRMNVGHDGAKQQYVTFPRDVVAKQAFQRCRLGSIAFLELA